MESSSTAEAFGTLERYITHDYNITAWIALLGDGVSQRNADISPYASPARATTSAGLPLAYIDVDDLKISVKEDVAYAARLFDENISTELHVYPGVPRAFEVCAPNIGSIRNRSLCVLVQI